MQSPTTSNWMRHWRKWGQSPRRGVSSSSERSPRRPRQRWPTYPSLLTLFFSSLSCFPLSLSPLLSLCSELLGERKWVLFTWMYESLFSFRITTCQHCNSSIPLSPSNVQQIEGLFSSDHCPNFSTCEFAENDCWYITFDSEEDTQKVFSSLLSSPVSPSSTFILSLLSLSSSEPVGFLTNCLGGNRDHHMTKPPSGSGGQRSLVTIQPCAWTISIQPAAFWCIEAPSEPL